MSTEAVSLYREATALFTKSVLGQQKQQYRQKEGGKNLRTLYRHTHSEILLFTSLNIFAIPVGSSACSVLVLVWKWPLLCRCGIDDDVTIKRPHLAACGGDEDEE